MGESESAAHDREAQSGGNSDGFPQDADTDGGSDSTSASAGADVTSDTKTEQFDEMKLDYEQTVSVIRMLTDARFKLLALVPTVSALGVVIAKDRSLGDAIGIATIGAVATVGVLLYELRNSQLYGAAMHRAKTLEKRMSFERSNLDRPISQSRKEPSDRERDWWKGGVFAERPRPLRLAVWNVKHDRALALVYAAAMTGWTYVLSSALLPIVLQGRSLSTMRLDASAEPTWLPAAVALVVGVFTWVLIKVFDRRGDDKRSPPPEPRGPREHKPPLLVSLLIHPTKKGIRKNEALYDANRPARAESNDATSSISRRAAPPLLALLVLAAAIQGARRRASQARPQP